MIDRALAVCAALNMVVGVGAGAFGAHGLKRVLSADMLAAWQTAVTYHLIHGLAILAISIAVPRMASSTMPLAGWMMFAGIVLFSGSLYALALTGQRWLGPVTPLGGVAFMAGWLMLAWSAWRAA